jgi:hypothetical protein
VTPFVGYQQTQAAANNARAQAKQQAVGITGAGAGLRRGAGQRSFDAYRTDTARAMGVGAAQQIQDEDRFANQGMALQQNSMNDAFRLGGAQQSAQLQQSEWNNRFNNMTTAWGALAGLLR